MITSNFISHLRGRKLRRILCPPSPLSFLVTRNWKKGLSAEWEGEGARLEGRGGPRRAKFWRFHTRSQEEEEREGEGYSSRQAMESSIERVIGAPSILMGANWHGARRSKGRRKKCGLAKKRCGEGGKRGYHLSPRPGWEPPPL